MTKVYNSSGRKESDPAAYVKALRYLKAKRPGVFQICRTGAEVDHSPLFENSGRFFHRLESANRSGDGNSEALPVAALQGRGHSASIPKTDDVIRRFNRDTQWLAAQVLGAVVFAILVLGILTRERDPNACALSNRRPYDPLVLDQSPIELVTHLPLAGGELHGAEKLQD